MTLKMLSSSSTLTLFSQFRYMTSTARERFIMELSWSIAQLKAAFVIVHQMQLECFCSYAVKEGIPLLR